MKKLLVLSLVLGIASLASASLTLTLDGATGSTASLDGLEIVSPGSLAMSAVTANSTVGYDIIVAVSDGLTIDSSGVVFLDTAAWMFGNTFVGVPTDEYARLTGGAFMAVAAGTGAFENLVINGEGTITLDEIIDDGSHVVSTITVIPEPATMALLGLGALVLRRKK